mgnify:CR=1 FL=1|tara:strand:- start:129 stop:521 length:393 start_codon:yes stop_codon:yes gene_type:complete
MLGRILKYGFFLRLYLLTKDRIFKWFIYLLLVLFIFYIHSEVVALSNLIDDKSLIINSYIIKNSLLLIILVVFLINETRTFKAKKKPNNPDRNLNNDKEKKTISNNDDPFVNIRAKKTLNTYAEKILKDK